MSRLNDVVVWTAIVTPLSPRGEIDFVSFENLLRRQENAGNGVIVLGSTGEGLALSLEQKRAVVESATKLKLKVPLMAGVAGFALPDCQDWIRWCESKGIEGFLLVTPIYAKPGEYGQEAWFKALLETSTSPCMIYNVPSRAAVKLHASALHGISNHRNFWALKESSGSTSEFLTYRNAAPKARFYCGDDGLMPYFASAGAVGLVSVAANVWPEATRRYAEESLKGRHAGLLPIWHEASESLFTASNPVPVKALLAHKGWIACANTLPPLSSRDLSNMNALLKADRAVQSWFDGSRS
jgi:4-hydroxy-tetrahydrodipicolinate synthase